MDGAARPDRGAKGAFWNCARITQLRDGRLVIVCDHIVGSERNKEEHLTNHLWFSSDGGETWDGPYPTCLPGCHRPVAGFLRSGRVLLTYRFIQGGLGGWGRGTQDFFAALMDEESVRASDRRRQWARILPIDFDRNPKSDLGYSGWVQFKDGEIYVVNYILDDWPRGQIRGYSLREEEFGFPEP